MFCVHFSIQVFLLNCKAHLANIFLHFVIKLFLLFMVILFVFTFKEFLEVYVIKSVRLFLYISCLPLWMDTSFTLGETKMSAYILLWLFLALIFTFNT